MNEPPAPVQNTPLNTSPQARKTITPSSGQMRKKPSSKEPKEEDAQFQSDEIGPEVPKVRPVRGFVDSKCLSSQLNLTSIT